MSKQQRNVSLMLCVTLALAACNGQQAASPNGQDHAPAGAGSAATSAPKDASSQDEMGATATKANAWLDIVSNKLSISLPRSAGGSVGDLNFVDTGIYDLPDKVKGYLKAVDKDGELDMRRLTGQGSAIGQQDGLERMFMMTTFAAYTDPTDASRQKYLDFLKKVAALSPSLPSMDQAGLAFGQRVVDLSVTFSSIHHYYESGAYKLDDFKQGKALHHQLVEQYKAYRAAGQALEEARDALYQEQHQKELAQLQQDGKVLMVSIYQASDAVDDLMDGLVARWSRDGNLDGLDVKQLQAKVDRLEQLSAGVKKFQGQSDRLQQEHVSNDNFEHFTQAIDDALISAKVLIKELHQGHDRELLQNLQEKRERVVSQFNDIVS